MIDTQLGAMLDNAVTMPSNGQTPRLIHVTPDLAAKMLQFNTNNRPIRESIVAKYTNDMLHERWTPGINDIITFNAKGQLSNGQQRLTAVVRSQRAQYFWVLTEMDPKAFNNMDNGMTRRTTDYLSMGKHATYARELSPMLGILYAMQCGEATMTNTLYGRVARNISSSRNDVLDSATQENCEKLEQLIISARKIANTQFQRRYVTNIAIALMFITELNRADDDVIDSFITDMQSTTPAYEPVAKLIKTIDTKTIGRQQVTKFSRQDIVALTLGAFEAFTANKISSKAIANSIYKTGDTLTKYDRLLQNYRQQLKKHNGNKLPSLPIA